MDPTYTIAVGPDAKGKVRIKRVGDGLVATCKLTRLKLVLGSDTVYEAKSNTKAIRLDGLEWTTEEG